MTLIERLHEWLGEDGRKFFTGLYLQHGEKFGVAVLKQECSIPHPVHLREGMQVRNWLRDQQECQEWHPHTLDNEWSKLVLQAIKLTAAQTIFDRIKRRKPV